MAELNGQLEKVRAYVLVVRELWDNLGLPTILLAVITALWIGWFPSPLLEARELIERHVAKDAEVLFYLKQTCIANMKLANMPHDSCTWLPGKSSP